MDREAIIESVKAQMPERRWLHVQGVMETSIILAQRFGADAERAELAAILHDVAKYWPTERMARIIADEQLPQELLEYDKELWHAPVGAFVAERDYGITDAEVLDAIRYHTSGRVGMTLLEKIVCLADYMEPGRDFPGVDKIRQEAEHSVEKALLAGFDSTISFLLEKEKRIFPLTVAARNAMIQQLREAEE
ncbi:bis(5'-nucleosyl)-tetraphosphatase (symmetrical) YqeK [Paenibacillus sp. MMS18-CY102]|uniref:bis(5'-nucleosyl)-tetraphosphatase (symmetrical) YqeK n=1 Tax=Paenibacillus sp. MMS18-CY102 TaxID=2682849 RepID=UPI0013666BF1|nr:bis(5'-nucleosyl)-tetraphosphatase (symmetrical) YqeK [Paenibacillus sp. MMS18-CY102]MWC27549.1 HD domain-containing protein [Paenibacillus sp. MMS18-CY102]